MKNSRIKSVVKNLSLAAIGTLVLLGFVVVPKMTVKAESESTGVTYSDKCLTITGTIVNDPDLKTGIVLPAALSIDKKEVEHILVSSTAVFPVNAYGLFEGFDNVTSIAIQSSNMTNTTNTRYMFNNLSKLSGLSITGVNTSHVTQMTGMFNGCSSLTKLDLSSFTVSQIQDTTALGDNMDYVFSACSNLETIIVPATWSLNASVNGVNMFYGDYKLKGGNGTVYTHPSGDTKMASFARIDKVGEPGYLSVYGSLLIGAQLKTDGSRFILSVSIDQGEDYSAHTYVVSYGDITNYATIDLGGSTSAPRVGSFELNACAKELNDGKTMIIKKDGTEVFNNQVSIAYYLRRLFDISDSDSDADNKIKNMAGSILRYGAAAQKFFNHNTDNLANKGIDGYTDYTHNIDIFTGVSDTAFNATAMNNAFVAAGYKDDSAVTYSQMNLSFDEDLTFMMAFKVPNGTSATYVADENLANLIKSKHKQSEANYSLHTGGANYIVTMTKNINVKNLDSAVFGSTEFGQDVTPVLYLYRVYKGTSNENMKNLAVALYDFHVRAKAY